MIEAKLESNQKEIALLKQALSDLKAAHGSLEREASFLRVREVSSAGVKANAAKLSVSDSLTVPGSAPYYEATIYGLLSNAPACKEVRCSLGTAPMLQLQA